MLYDTVQHVPKGWELVKSAWVPRKMVSNNVLIRMRFPQRSRITREWHKEVEPAGHGKRQQPGTLRRLLLVRVIGSGGRAYDEDNLIGGAKLLIDALVVNHWLLNDTPKHLDLAKPAQERGPHEGVAWYLMQEALEEASGPQVGT